MLLIFNLINAGSENYLQIVALVGTARPASTYKVSAGRLDSRFSSKLLEIKI